MDWIDRAQTDDVTEAEALMSGAYCRHRLMPRERRADLDLDYVSLAFGSSRFSVLQYGCEVVVDPDSFETFYMLEMPLSGGVDIRYGTENVRSNTRRALLLSPGRRLVSRWAAGTRQLMLLIDRTTVERRLTELSRRPRTGRPIFNPVIDLSTAHGRRIAGNFRLLAAALAEQDATVADEVMPEVLDTLLQNIAFEHEGSIVPERLSVTPRHVKLALELFQARLGERLSMAAVAREVGVSERSLFQGFEHYYQRSPYEMLTRMRLAAAQQMIRGGLAVADAATKVGMRHLGRFAAAYRDVYGHLPSAERASPG
jgi:AraC-like DNA-binding protein